MNQPTEFEQLFSYGSLQHESVQQATFGRPLLAVPDRLVGYRTLKIAIHDRTAAAANNAEYYLNAVDTGYQSESVAGTRLYVTKSELAQADAYEASAKYHRVRVRLESGTEAWMYVSAAPHE